MKLIPYQIAIKGDDTILLTLKSVFSLKTHTVSQIDMDFSKRYTIAFDELDKDRDYFYILKDQKRGVKPAKIGKGATLRINGIHAILNIKGRLVFRYEVVPYMDEYVLKVSIKNPIVPLAYDKRTP